MITKTHLIEGTFKTFDKSEDFDIEFELPKSGVQIKGLSRKILINKGMQKEHAIYILEGPNKSYVGKTTDLQSRIINHKTKNKSDFNRCFILSKKGTDLRQYLDYMEAYTIQKIDNLGYDLDNLKKPNPTEDILNIDRKELANSWVDEFLSFLPILGFTKSKKIIPTLIKPINIIKENSELPSIIQLKLNGELISGKNNKEILKLLLENIGLEKVIKYCTPMFNSSFNLSENYIQSNYGKCYEIIENNKQYYFFIHSSKKDILTKIKKIKIIFNLDLDIID